MDEQESFVGGPQQEDADWYRPEVATFGDRLAAARENASFSQSDLAKRLGIKKSTLVDWEDDLNEPRANKLQMLSGMLGVSMRWLLTGENAQDGAPSEAPVARSDAAMLAEIREIRAQMLASAERLAKLEKQLRNRDGVE